MDLKNARVGFISVSRVGPQPQSDGYLRAADLERLGLLERDIDKAEAAAARELLDELRDHLAAATFAYDLVSQTLQSVNGRALTRAFAVCIPLMMRLSNDLRAAIMLTSRGYPAQANGVVAGMFEVAYTVAALDSDLDLVNQWLSHDDPTRLFKPVRWLVEEGLRKIGAPDPQQQAVIEYQVYSQLCMLKHAHPRIQITLGVQLGDHEMSGYNGPDLSEQATRASRFALEDACDLVFVALASFLQSHVPPDPCRVLAPQVQRLGQWRKKLGAASTERYGTEDPFPGKWRQ